MGLPGISAGSLGGVASAGAGGVTPGSGSSGFTDPRVIVSQAGALNDGPTDVYEFAVDAGNDLTVRYAMELGGAGALVIHIPTTPATAGQRGWDFETIAGPGAAASAAVVGGAGADNYVVGGQGGAGSAARAAGAGGHAIIVAGAAGANGGGGGANGGSVFVDASDGTGAGVSGSVLIATQTASTFGTRYVQVGPAGGTVPLLVDVAAPVGAELVNVAGDTNALTIFGRTFIGTPVASDEVVIGHYDARASTTQYTVRSSAPAATSAALFNTPATSANGTLYLQLGGSFSAGWTIGDNLGNFQLRPLTSATADIGSTALKVRDLHLSRDVYVGDDIELLASVDHDIYVATASGAGGSLNIFAAAGITSGNGGSVTVTAGNAATSAPGTPRTGGSVTILAGEGAGDASVGGNVIIDAAGGSTTQGSILLGTVEACPIVVGHASSLVTFYNGTPVARGAAVADAAGGATVDAEARTAINALLARIRAVNLIAT